MPPLPLVPYPRPLLDDATLAARALAVHRDFDNRRSIREFSDRPVDAAVIAGAIAAASTAPSGAHMQPWHFCAVSDPALKHQIRLAAEEEERRSYEGRMNDEWLAALALIGTTWEKPFLDVAPWLVVVFAQAWGEGPDGGRVQHYYVRESVGIAVGLFIAAIHEIGLCTLTHTPSPMAFLGDLLGRPGNERAFVLLPVGHAAPDCAVPDLRRKPLAAVSSWFPPRDG